MTVPLVWVLKIPAPPLASPWCVCVARPALYLSGLMSINLLLVASDRLKLKQVETKNTMFDLRKQKSRGQGRAIAG